MHSTAQASQIQESDRVRDAQLRDTARSMDRSAFELRGEQSAEAAAVWQGFVAGRWSLVDRFDSGGRRYLVVKRNDPETQVATALSPLEQRVVTYASLGYANKFMAYELGISQPRISELLKRACMKLGLRSRLDLVQVLSAAGQRSEPIASTK